MSAVDRDESFKVTRPSKSPAAESPVVPAGGETESPVRATTSDIGQRLGRQLAGQMDEQGYHPVVLFGSSASGKSSLLASLLAYLQVDTTAKVEIQLGDRLLLDDQDYGSWAHDEATAFFYRSVEEFIGGTAHPATVSKNPFFIPVVLKPHNGMPEAKFAFLESRGEWYQPKMETNEVFQRLREEVSGVLLNFPKGISFLHVAPYTQVNTWDEDAASQQVRDVKLRHEADLALVGALNAYKAVRPLKHQDAHLFLVTKWDAYAPPGAPSGSFSSPTVDEVTGVAKDRYSRGFSAFFNLNLGDDQHRWQKQIMQYSSGLISGRSILAPTGDVKDQVYRYPRVMWNWLYENATRSDGACRKLFASPPPPKPTLMDGGRAALARILRFMGV